MIVSWSFVSEHVNGKLCSDTQILVQQVLFGFNRSSMPNNTSLNSLDFVWLHRTVYRPATSIIHLQNIVHICSAAAAAVWHRFVTYLCKDFDDGNFIWVLRISAPASWCSLRCCLKSVTSLRAKYFIGQFLQTCLFLSVITWIKDPIALLWIIFKARGCTGRRGREKLLVSSVARILSSVKWCSCFDLRRPVQHR